MLYLVFDAIVRVRCGDVRQILFECTDIWINRHAIVVEDDEHVGVLDATVVQSFKGQTRGHRPIPNHGHVLHVALAVVAAADGHAQRCAHARAAVSYPKRVILALAALGEAADALVLAVGVKAFAAPRQDFMPVRLVSHVPDDLIFRGIERVVERDGQFDHAEARPEVTALFRDDVHNELA